jgi:tRNA dimethylallyltransferase
LISLEPLNRAWLHARIERRFELMLAQGFLQEMQDLRARGDLHPELPSMRCVGYRQAWAWLDGLPAQERAWVDADPSEMIRQGQAATRQLAKRQLTWLRSLPERQCVACDAEDVEHQVLARVTQAWGPP